MLGKCMKMKGHRAIGGGGRAAAGLVGVLVCIALLGSTTAVHAVLLERVGLSDIGESAECGASAISANGRVVAFESSDLHLVPGDLTGVQHVYVRDRDACHTELVSMSSTGEFGEDNSSRPQLSADGRYVVFLSCATNLVPGDAGGGVYLRDRLTGVTELVSVNSAGEPANGGSCGTPAISSDGRFVAFASGADNLVPGDGNYRPDVFVRDRLLGTTERVSISTSGEEGDGWSYAGYISEDGRFVTFLSSSTNLVPGAGGLDMVFLRDRLLGTTECVSVSSTGELVNDRTDPGPVSADGRYVLFSSMATNLFPGDTNNTYDVFLRDRVAGTTELVSANESGEQGDGWSDGGCLSADGRFVCFTSSATNLVPNDTNNDEDIFLVDRVAGTVQRVSVSESGTQGNSDSAFPSMSANGRCIAFQAYASNLLPNGSDFGGGLLVWDLDAGPKPLANFFATPKAGVRPFTVAFTDTSVHTPTAWEWHFGDGGTSTEQNPTHTYLNEGTHLVWLTASNAYGRNSFALRSYIAVSFLDVPIDYWSVASILACVDADIVHGYPGDVYVPDEPVNRAQMAVFTARSLAKGDVNVPTGPATPTFPDVACEYWAYKYIEYCHANDIVNGYPDGYFYPEEVVNRAQIAGYMARTFAGGDAHVPTGGATAEFPDVPTDFWAYKYIDYCFHHNIVAGYPDGSYRPEIILDRGQMAAFIQRTFRLPVSPWYPFR